MEKNNNKEYDILRTKLLKLKMTLKLGSKTMPEEEYEMLKNEIATTRKEIAKVMFVSGEKDNLLKCEGGIKK